MSIGKHYATYYEIYNACTKHSSDCESTVTPIENLFTYLMKLCIVRLSNGSKIIMVTVQEVQVVKVDLKSNKMLKLLSIGYTTPRTEFLRMVTRPCALKAALPLMPSGFKWLSGLVFPFVESSITSGFGVVKNFIAAKILLDCDLKGVSLADWLRDFWRRKDDSGLHLETIAPDCLNILRLHCVPRDGE